MLNRDDAAARNIRAEGLRQLQLQADGTAVSASGSCLRRKGGQKSVLSQPLVRDEAHSHFKDEVQLFSDTIAYSLFAIPYSLIPISGVPHQNENCYIRVLFNH